MADKPPLLPGAISDDAVAALAASERAALTRLIVVLGAAGFSSTFTMRLLDPLVPTLASEFARPVSDIALMATGFSFAYAVGQPFLGPLADSLGKVRTILASLCALAVALALASRAGGYDLLFVARLAMGVFAGGIIPVAMAAIGDRAPMAGRQVALGRFLTLMMIGQMSGAAASGLIADMLGWRSVMLTGAAVAALGAVLVAVLLRPRAGAAREPLSAATALARYRSVFANPNSVILYGIVIVEGALIFGLMPYVAAILDARSGVGATQAGLVVGSAGLGGLAYGFFVAPLVRRLGPRGMPMLGGLLMALAFTVFSLPLPWWVGIGCFFVQGFGFFLLHGTLQAQATELAPQARGSAMAMFACTLFLGHALGPVLVGALLPALGVTPALTLLAGGLLALGWATPRWLRL